MVSKFFAITAITTFMATTSWAGSCLDNWEDTQQKLTDLRKHVGCSVQYNAKECAENLGLGLGAVGAAKGAKSAANAYQKRQQFKTSGSCAIGGGPVAQHSFFDLLISESTAAVPISCMSNVKLRALKDEYQKLLEEQIQAMRNQVKQILESKDLKGTLNANPRLIQLHQEAYENFIESLAEKDLAKSEAFANKAKKAQQEIEKYIQASGANKEKVKVLSDSLRITYTLRDGDAAMAYWQKFAPEIEASLDPRIKSLNARMSLVQGVRSQLASRAPSAESLALQLEKGADYLGDDQAILKKLAGLRTKLGEISPSTPMKSTSRLASQFMRVAGKNGKSIAFKVFGAGVGGVVTIAGEAFAATPVGCAMKDEKSPYVTISEDCKPVVQWDSKIEDYLMLSPEMQKQEMVNAPSLCKVVQELHAERFPPNAAAQCQGDKVQFRDNKKRFVETMSWDSQGLPVNFQNSRAQGVWTDFSFDFQNGQIQKLNLQNKSQKKTITAANLETSITPGFDNQIAVERYLNMRPLMMQLSACCRGSLDSSDPRCSLISNSQSSGSNSSGSGVDSSGGSGAGGTK